ncbi:MAG: prolipoprotein diacylglyceryl transferase, partial [Clostridia bacterium]|nr:prolipoprotein diacylglyceryl transferase [Clostridia bacterium]
GVILTTGIVLGVLYAYSLIKKAGINEDTFFNLVLIIVPVSILSARLYYVIFDPTPNYHSFLDVIAIWRGGIGIYGAVIGGALTAIIFAKIAKIPLLKLLDCLAPAVMIGQIIGRWGNFVNAEAHGTLTALPWRMGISPVISDLPYDETLTLYYHPTFLYESIWNFVGFLLIHFALRKRKKYDGECAFFYLFWYGLGRGFIELLRTDSLEIIGLKVSSLVGFVCAIVFGTILVVRKKNKSF